MIEITLPQIDENVVEYTIGQWLKKPGDTVLKDEPVVEVETDKVTMEVVSESAGVLSEVLAQPGDVLRPGDLLARLTPSANGASIPLTKVERAVAKAEPIKTVISKTETRCSPVVKRMVADHRLDLEEIEGSGKNGRVTKKDVLAFLEVREEKPEIREEKKDNSQLSTDNGQWAMGPTKLGLTERSSSGKRSDIVNLSPMRRSIAEHMVRSLATSPHVTTVFEFDFHQVAQHRAKHKAAFAADGVKLTYMAYLSLATVQALKKFPLVNSQFHDEGIELKKAINLGIIVAVPDGLYAPVIHHADEYNLKGVARAIGDLSEKAHSGQLTPADLQNGTFTISNHGAAGSIAGTPIIFQPQAGILGVGAIEDRVKVINKGMHIRPCAYISFSFDHRIMDGAISDGFCSEIKRIIESWPEE